MKTKAVALGVVLLLTAAARNAAAKETNLTGVYTAAFDCRDVHAKYSLRVIHNADGWLNVQLSEYPAGSGSGAPSAVLEMRGQFQMVGLEVLLRPTAWKAGPSRVNRWMGELLIAVTPAGNELVGRFGYQCGRFPFKRDSKLSKELTSRIKNERKELEKAAAKHPGGIDLRKLAGLWEGVRLARYQQNDYRLFVVDNKAWLVIAGSGYKAFALTPEKIVDGGDIVFRLDGAEAEGLDFVKVQTAVVPARWPYAEHVKLLLLPRTGRPSGSVELNRPLLPGAEQVTASGRQAYFYQDWRYREYSSTHRVSEEETRGRLTQTMARLKEAGGWRCLSQTTHTVNPRRSVRIASRESAPDRLYLIYSPQGNAGLIYKAVPSENGVIIGARYDYPVVHSVRRTFFYSDTVITLIAQPSPAEPPAAAQPIDVTIFVLGRAPGDYGTGCSY